jgi:2-methylisocitrate lyase-like PEP mutase family enzyme
VVVSEDLAAGASRLRELHRPGHPLVLPNAWDPPSAVAVERAGFPIVATSSSAMLASIGRQDGGTADPDDVFAAVGWISRAVGVPVTADIEDGYGLPPDELAERLIAAGVVGANLEDSDHRQPGQLVDPEHHAERIAGLRAAGRTRGVDLVVNARIDTYVRRFGEPGDRLEETARRALAYLDAGADCVYPILAPEDEIGRLLARIPGPLNAMTRPEADGVTRLAGLGVARISMGGQLARAVGEFLGGLLGDLRTAIG